MPVTNASGNTGSAVTARATHRCQFSTACRISRGVMMWLISVEHTQGAGDHVTLWRHALIVASNNQTYAATVPRMAVERACATDVSNWPVVCQVAREQSAGSVPLTVDLHRRRRRQTASPARDDAD